MNKKLLSVFILGIFLFASMPLAVAMDDIGTFKKGDTIQLIQICDSCTYVNLTTVILPNGTSETYNNAMTVDGLNYYLDYNVSEIGDYKYVVCGDKGSSLMCETFSFSVTQTGGENNFTQLFSRIFLVLVVLGLVIFIQYKSKKMNYDGWYDKMVKRWEDKNTVKFALSALAYNLFKNSYIFSYLAGLFGFLILTDLIYFFNIDSALQVTKILFGLYTWSSIAVVLIFFSQVQEWFTQWKKDIEDLKWGFEK